jgi:hypothetical protein
MDRFADHAVGGEGAFQHGAAGEVDDFHLEDRLFFINDGRYCGAAAFQAILPKFLQFFHYANPSCNIVIIVH